MITKMGGIHINCPVDEIVVDDEYRVVTPPAYMLAESIKHKLRWGLRSWLKSTRNGTNNRVNTADGTSEKS